jgi:two-component system cell cycle sensor histidine kinase/response regulator CckA
MSDQESSRAQGAGDPGEPPGTAPEADAPESESRRVQEVLEQRNRQLELLYCASQTFNSTLDLDQVFDTILEEIRRLLEVTICSVWLVDHETGELVCRQATDPGREIVRGWHLAPGVGISGWAAKTGQKALVPDAQVDERHFKEIDRLTGLTSRSVLAVPLLVRDGVTGVLEVIDERADRFDHADLTVLELVATSAATAIDNARLLRMHRERGELAEALATAAATVNSSLEIDEVLDRILAQVQRVVAGDTFNIMLVEEDRVRIVRSRGYERAGADRLMPTEAIPVDRYPSLHRMMETGEAVLIPDTITSPQWVRPHGREWRRSYVGAPISVEDRVVGFLNVNGTRPGQFGPGDAQRLSIFANYAATAIDNAQLFRRTQQEITDRMQAEKALRESEERFRRLSEASEEGVAIHDQGVIVDANEALARMFGYHLPEMIGMTTDRLVLPHSWQAATRHPGTGVERPLEVLGVRKDGSIFPCELGAKPYPYQDRTFHVAILRDITERKRNEEELRRRAVQQEALNAIIAAAVAASDLSELLDVILDYSLRATELKIGAVWTAGQYATRGVPREIGKKLGEVAGTGELHFPGTHMVEDWGQVESGGAPTPFGQTLAQHGVCASLTVPIMVEGRRIGGLSLASARPRSWSEGEIALAEAIGRQVGATAERLRLLEAIRKQAQQMQQIMDSVPEGVLLLDAEGQVLLANPLGEDELLALASARVGDTLTHLGGRPLADLLAPPPSGLWHEVQLEAPRTRVFEMIARPVESQPQSRGWVVVLRDVTQERQLELHTRQQERLAAVGQLAAGIAHDFNNIMAVVVLYTQMMMRMPDLPAELLQRLRTVEHQARQAGNLIQQILDFSRRAVFERKPVDLLPLLREQAEILERTLPESIEVELSSEEIPCDAEGPTEYTILADPTRIQQVIMNLAVNARDAMPMGGKLRIELGRLTVRDEREAPMPGMDQHQGNWVRIRVSDSGTGIPAEALAHVFEPFFTTKSAGGGTGLGLAQVYGIIKQHEGHIDVVSEPGVGTSFSIYLPALSVSQPESARPARQTLMHGNGELVLIVEDNAATRRALVEGLEQLNYRAMEAENGREALDLYRRHGSEIALVLTDLVMPEMGGEALARALRERDQSLPIVVITGHPMQDMGQELEVMGVADWLQKPVDLEGLARLVHQGLTG